MHLPTAQRIVKIVLSGLGATLILGSAVFYIIDQSERERERERDNDTELLVDKTAPTARQQTTATFSQLPEEKIINTAKPPDLIEQPLDSEEESFAVLATKLDLDNNIYQLAFTLANTSDQDKDFYLIPVSLAHQARFQGIRGSLAGGQASWNFDSGWSFDQAKHKQELIPALAQAYDDIDNNGYTGHPIKLTLTPKTTLTAQSEWALKNPNDPTFVETTAGRPSISAGRQNSEQNALKPVYFLVYGSAGGAKDELTILNVHSHPQQGENWTVSFETKGTADLTITPTNQATIDDDEFVSLSCLPAEALAKEGDGKERTPQILAGDVIYYPNWECSGEGKVVHYTKKAGKHTLRFEFGGQTAFAYNNPDTETLRPNGAGSETSAFILDVPSAGDHWDKVDEETADDNSTYVYLTAQSAGGNWRRDLYALPAHTGSGTINSVTVYARLRDFYGSNSSGKISIRTNGTTYDTSAYALTTSWATKSNVWTTNPQTGSAWTWDEIDALEAGISLYEYSEPPPECPFFYSWNGSDYVYDTQIIYDLDSKEKETLQYRNLSYLDTGDVIKGVIKEEEQETSYIDQIYLEIIDTKADSTIKTILKPITASRDLSLILESDDKYLVTNYGDEVYLEFEKAPELLDGYSREVKIVAEGFYTYNSFSIVKGQPVLMADGSQKNIEDIKVGDEIISFNLDSQKAEKDKVNDIIQGNHDDYLVFNGALKTSLNHAIWVNGEFKPAEDIKIGDFLLNSEGQEIEVTQIEYVQEKVETYDLVIEKNHNFFASNYLVHNQNKSGACTQVYVVVDYTPAATGPSLIFKGGLRFKGGYTIK